MTELLDIVSLRTPNSPDHEAFVNTIAEALEESIERDLNTLQVKLHYAGRDPMGRPEPMQLGRKMEFPADGSDARQIADKIVKSFEKRSPGEGFQGKIRVQLEDPTEHGESLGLFERYVHIGEINHQMHGYGQHQLNDPYGPQGPGGYGPPQPPGFGGGFSPGGFPPPQGPFVGHHDPHQGFPGGPMEMDELNEEKQGMMLAMAGANERRLDMALRQNQFMMERFMEINSHYLQTQGYVMQLAAYYMNQYQPPPQAQGGNDNPMAGIIGGIISMMMGGGGAGKVTGPKQPAVPVAPMPGSLPPQPDAYVPYEPTEAPDDFHGGGSGITEEQAQEWAQENPDAAKRVARGLLPPAMQGLIPE